MVQRSFWDAHNGVLGLVLDLALSQTLTVFIKVSSYFSRKLSFYRVCSYAELVSNALRSQWEDPDLIYWTDANLPNLSLRIRFTVSPHGQSAPVPICFRMDLEASRVVIPVLHGLGCGI